MGLADAFSKEDRIPVRFSDFYVLTRESVKAELLMNAVKCQVPHKYMYEMATGEKLDQNGAVVVTVDQE